MEWRGVHQRSLSQKIRETGPQAPRIGWFSQLRWITRQVGYTLTTCYGLSDLPRRKRSHVCRPAQWGLAIWVVCHRTHVFQCTRAQNIMLVTNLPLQATSLTFPLPFLHSALSPCPPLPLHHGPFPSLCRQLQSPPSGKAPKSDGQHLGRHRSTRTVPSPPRPRHFLPLRGGCHPP